MKRPWPPTTSTERARYRRWWIEQSGLSREELVGHALGLGGRQSGADGTSAEGRRFSGLGLRGLLAGEEYDLGGDDLAA